LFYYRDRMARALEAEYLADRRLEIVDLQKIVH
jgi:hypothetical protein